MQVCLFMFAYLFNLGPFSYSQSEEGDTAGKEKGVDFSSPEKRILNVCLGEAAQSIEGMACRQYNIKIWTKAISIVRSHSVDSS